MHTSTKHHFRVTAGKAYHRPRNQSIHEWTNGRGEERSGEQLLKLSWTCFVLVSQRGQSFVNNATVYQLLCCKEILVCDVIGNGVTEDQRWDRQFSDGGHSRRGSETANVNCYPTFVPVT